METINKARRFAQQRDQLVFVLTQLADDLGRAQQTVGQSLGWLDHLGHGGNFQANLNLVRGTLETLAHRLPFRLDEIDQRAQAVAGLLAEAVPAADGEPVPVPDGGASPS